MDRVILIYNKKTNIEKFAVESDPNYTFTFTRGYLEDVESKMMSCKYAMHLKRFEYSFMLKTTF